MASENIKEFSDQNFEQEVVKSSVPVLVDFWAEWCMPCRMLAPTIEKIANEYSGKVTVGKVDTDASRDVSLKFGISAIPTVILFKNGEIVPTLRRPASGEGLQGRARCRLGRLISSSVQVNQKNRRRALLLVGGLLFPWPQASSL